MHVVCCHGFTHLFNCSPRWSIAAAWRLKTSLLLASPEPQACTQLNRPDDIIAQTNHAVKVHAEDARRGYTQRMPTATKDDLPPFCAIQNIQGCEPTRPRLPFKAYTVGMVRTVKTAYLLQCPRLDVCRNMLFILVCGFKKMGA